MMDKASFTHAYRMGLLTSPLTLFPLAGGAGLAATAFLMHWPAAWLWAGAGAMLLGAGVLLHGLARGNERIARQVLSEMEAAARRQQRQALEALGNMGALSRQPRVRQMLADLGALAEAFEKDAGWSKGMRTTSARAMAQTVHAIIGQCIESLRVVLKGSAISGAAASTEVREAVGARDERLLEQVQQSILQLSATLEAMGTLGGEGRPEERLSELGRDLTMQLEAAKNVDRRMRTLRLDGTEREETAE